MLVYSTICSLDGYVADREGEFGWAVLRAGPVQEFHAFLVPVVVGDGPRRCPGMSGSGWTC